MFGKEKKNKLFDWISTGLESMPGSNVFEEKDMVEEAIKQCKETGKPQTVQIGGVDYEVVSDGYGSMIQPLNPPGSSSDK